MDHSSFEVILVAHSLMGLVGALHILTALVVHMLVLEICSLVVAWVWAVYMLHVFSAVLDTLAAHILAAAWAGCTLAVVVHMACIFVPSVEYI